MTGDLVHGFQFERAIKSIIVPNRLGANCSNLLGENDLVIDTLEKIADIHTSIVPSRYPKKVI